MHLAYAAVLLVLLTAGCTRVTPDTPGSEPPNVAAQPGTPPPAAKRAAPPQSGPPAPASARTPAPQAASTVAPAVAKTPAAPAVGKTPAAPALDLKTLKEQLRETKAIGFFTKITLKNQVDDLLDQFGEYYQGKAKLTMTDLRQSYDLLMMKVLSLLQDEDRKLASDIVSSREAIWRLLANPKTFATLQS